MDELTLSHELSLFREFRSDAPGPSAAETEAARARLLDAMAAEGMSAARRASSRRWVWLRHLARTRVWAPVAAAAAVTAIAVTVSLVAAPPGGSTPKPKSSHATTHQGHQHRRQKSRSAHPAQSTSDASAGQGSATRTGRRTTASGGAPGSPTESGSSGLPPTSSGPSTPTITSLDVSPVLGNGEQPVTLGVGVTDHSGDNLTGGTVTIYLEPQSTGSQVAPASETPVCVDVPLTYSDGINNDGSCYYRPTEGETEQTDLFVAEYSGYGPYERSGSNSATLNVPSVTDPVTTLSATVSGLTVTMTATVTDLAGDNLSDDGNLSFMAPPDIAGELGPECYNAPLTYDPTAHVNTATCTFTLLTPGTYILAAVFTDSRPYPYSYSYSYSNEVTVTAGG
jgi:hypothetical protein